MVRFVGDNFIIKLDKVMKSRYLFPYKSRWIGLALVILHIPIWHIWMASNPGVSGKFYQRDDQPLYSPPHLIYMIISLMMIVGLFLIAFSKEKIEDEQITQLRLESLQWSIYLNYAILLVTIVFTSNVDYFDMLRLNLWVPLLFFIARFRWVLYRLNRSLRQP